MKVEVDQVYAHYQEVGDFHHPEGGEQYALRGSLYEKNAEHMERLASAVTIEEETMREAAIDVAESISSTYYEKAPLEFGDLKGSGHPSVEDDGAIVYDRPPHVHRLSKEELRDKHELRWLFPVQRRRRARR